MGKLMRSIFLFLFLGGIIFPAFAQDRLANAELFGFKLSMSEDKAIANLERLCASPVESIKYDSDDRFEKNELTKDITKRVCSPKWSKDFNGNLLSFSNNNSMSVVTLDDVEEIHILRSLNMKPQFANSSRQAILQHFRTMFTERYGKYDSEIVDEHKEGNNSIRWVWKQNSQTDLTKLSPKEFTSYKMLTISVHFSNRNDNTSVYITSHLFYIGADYATNRFELAKELEKDADFKKRLAGYVKKHALWYDSDIRYLT